MRDHDHDHDHGAGGHLHHALDGVRSGPVVLDLGSGVGALIVHTAPGLLGAEVELSPAGDDEMRQHKQVLQRPLGGSTATVLVYDNLPEGDYTLWLDGAEPVRGIHVTGGRVAELDRRHAHSSG